MHLFLTLPRSLSSPSPRCLFSTLCAQFFNKRTEHICAFKDHHHARFLFDHKPLSVALELWATNCYHCLHISGREKYKCTFMEKKVHFTFGTWRLTCLGIGIKSRQHEAKDLRGWKSITCAQNLKRAFLNEFWQINHNSSRISSFFDRCIHLGNFYWITKHTYLICRVKIQNYLPLLNLQGN